MNPNRLITIVWRHRFVHIAQKELARQGYDSYGVHATTAYTASLTFNSAEITDDEAYEKLIALAHIPTFEINDSWATDLVEPSPELAELLKGTVSSGTVQRPRHLRTAETPEG